MARVAILISGRGSNARALLERAEETEYPATIVGILSDRPDAAGLASGAVHDVPVAVVERLLAERKVEHEERVNAVLREWHAEIVCLAGYMRVLSADFVREWNGRLLNIHPSLLPAFPGLDTHERALKRGVTIHGCTVHLVTEGVDEGPILAQAAVPVLPDDTPKTLASRVLAEEHKLYADALADWIEERTRLDADGRIVRTDRA